MSFNRLQPLDCRGFLVHKINLLFFIFKCFTIGLCFILFSVEVLKMNVELSFDQLATIETSFKTEHLKDEILLEKLLSDDYDFDLLDDEA